MPLSENLAAIFSYSVSVTALLLWLGDGHESCATSSPRFQSAQPAAERAYQPHHLRVGGGFRGADDGRHKFAAVRGGLQVDGADDVGNFESVWQGDRNFVAQVEIPSGLKVFGVD